MMTEENYKNFLEKYAVIKERQKAIKEAKENLITLKQEREKYEKDTIVRRYLEVISKIKENTIIANQKEIEEDSILEFIANENRDEENTNRIFVYMGSYVDSNEADIEHGPGIVRVFDENYSWREYKNIELNYAVSSINVDKKDVKQFEEENIVLYAGDNNSQKFYQLVRKTFFQNLVLYGQEEAVRRVLEEFKTTEEYQEFLLGRFMKRG